MCAVCSALCVVACCFVFHFVLLLCPFRFYSIAKAKGLISTAFLAIFLLIYMARKKKTNSNNTHSEVDEWKKKETAMRNKSIYAHNQKIHIACTLIYDIKCNNFQVFLFFCLRIWVLSKPSIPSSVGVVFSLMLFGQDAYAGFFQFNQFKFILNSQLTEQDYFHRYRSETMKE